MKYSAIIRTTGPSDLLDKTLNSLNEQTLSPEEILIVIPQEHEAWQTPYPSIRFVKSERGMISQRKTGIINATFRYALLLDDDIIFNDTCFAENAIRHLIENDAKAVIPFSADGYPQGFLSRLFYALFGLSIPTDKKHLSYTSGGGYYYPSKPLFNDYRTTEGGRGCIIVVDRLFLMEHELFGDFDLQTSNYPLREDGAFISAIVMAGGKSLLVGNLPYTHLGVARHFTSNRLYAAWKANIVNNFLFWRKHIYPRYTKNFRSRIFSTATFIWLITGYAVLAIVSSIKNRKLQPISGVLSGIAGIVKK